MKKHVFTLSSCLTLIRMISPIFIWIVYFTFPHYINTLAAFAVFGMAAMTDYFDGKIARLTNSISPLGAIFDPIADKMLLATSYAIFIYIHGLIVLIPVFVTVNRDLIVTFMRLYMERLNLSINVTGFAKWKTGFEMTATGALIMALHDGFFIHQFSWVVGVLTMWISMFLSLWTLFKYIKLFKEKLQTVNISIGNI